MDKMSADLTLSDSLKNNIIRKYLLGKTYEEAKYIAHSMRFQVCYSNLLDHFSQSSPPPYLCFLTVDNGIVVDAAFSSQINKSAL